MLLRYGSVAPLSKAAQALEGAVDFLSILGLQITVNHLVGGTQSLAHIGVVFKLHHDFTGGERP